MTNPGLPTYDAAIRKAYDKACRTGNRKAERSIKFIPFFSEVHDALSVVLTQMGYTKMPTKYALRRRLKILGYTVQGGKRGRPRKPTP